MQYTILFLFILLSIQLMAQEPTMQVWTEAWQQSDSLAFQNIYAENALIFPPNKASVMGVKNILDFMKGGMGKVQVVFIANPLIMSEQLAFEYGIFKDVRRDNQQVIGQGTYAITWVLDKGSWKIKCHTWSMPLRE